MQSGWERDSQVKKCGMAGLTGKNGRESGIWEAYWGLSVLCSTLHLFDLQIFFITVPQEARKAKSWGGTSMWASKRTLWVFTACKQLKNRETKCALILVVVRPTVVQSSFHTEFLSSIRFSPLWLLQRQKRTRNFFAFLSGHEEELKLSLPTTKVAIKTTDQEQFASVACTFLSFNWNHTAIHTTCDNWRWILIGDDRNLSVHRQVLMRFKNSFSLLSWKVKKLFLPFSLQNIYLSLLNLNSKK